MYSEKRSEKLKENKFSLYTTRNTCRICKSKDLITFLKFGNKIGAKTLSGMDMFIHQGLASLDLWFGESLSKQVNFTQLKTYLETKLC